MAGDTAELAERWVMPLLFATLGLALGSFLSSAYPLHLRPTWLFSLLKVVSADCGRVKFDTKRAWVFLGNETPEKGMQKREASESWQSPLNGSSDTPKEGNALASSFTSFNKISSDISGPAIDHDSKTFQSSRSPKPDPYSPQKRQGYLSWDDYFMAIAFLSAHRSKDPNRQVGACLVSQDKVILGRCS